MKRTPVPLEDIADVEGFAGAVVRRSIAKRMTQDERDEAVLQGVLILYDLHRVWDRARCASFYEFCTTYLEFRLIDWWRQEMRQRLLAHNLSHTKKRTPVYHGRLSLEQMREEKQDVVYEDEGIAAIEAMVATNGKLRGLDDWEEIERTFSVNGNGAGK